MGSKVQITHRFTGAVLFECDVPDEQSGMAMRHALEQATKSSADLSGAYLSGADLSGANLSGAYLYRADLSGADLERAFFQNANLNRTKLNQASARSMLLDRLSSRHTKSVDTSRLCTDNQFNVFVQNFSAPSRHPKKLSILHGKHSISGFSVLRVHKMSTDPTWDEE